MSGISIPGFVYTAVVLAVLTFLQALSTGLDSLADQWWQPVAVAALAAAIKAAQAWQASNAPATRSLDNSQRGFWSRFLWG